MPLEVSPVSVASASTNRADAEFSSDLESGAGEENILEGVVVARDQIVCRRKETDGVAVTADRMAPGSLHSREKRQCLAERWRAITPVVHVGITPRQVLRTKMFSTPFTVPPRFEASDEKAISWPEALTLGCSLKPLPGVTPSGVDTSVVEGVH